MSSTWRVDLWIHGADLERADDIVDALDEAWGEMGLHADTYEDDGLAEISTSGVDQLTCGGSFEELAADLAGLVWEVNGAYVAVDAAGTCHDDLAQGTWSSSEDDYAAWQRGEPLVPPSPPLAPLPAPRAAAVAGAIVVCRSMGDGDATAWGPFRGASFDAAVVTAKAWLRSQSCRPDLRDPFWDDPAALACERLLRGEDGPPGHEIVRLEAP